MNLKFETRTFGELEVTVTEFDAWRGFQMLPRVGGIVGPLLSATGDPSLALSMLPTICKEVAADENLLLDLFVSTTVRRDGKNIDLLSKKDINNAFNGHLWHMIDALQLVLEVNFSDFLSQLNKKLGEVYAKKMAEKASK